MNNKLRKIKLDGETYLWRREHHHLTQFKYSKCVEKVTVYLEGFKNSPLQLSFREEDNLMLSINIEKEKWCVGYPNDGVIWMFKSGLDNKTKANNAEINLNRPAVIAKLIKYFNLNGWDPRGKSGPFVESNALKLLEIIEFRRGIN